MSRSGGTVRRSPIPLVRNLRWSAGGVSLVNNGRIGTFEAFASNVTLDTGKVTGWANLSSGGHLTQASQPNGPVWNATGWNGNQPCLEITDAANNYLENTTDAIATMTAGADKAWSLMFTFQNTSAVASELYHGCWSNATQFYLWGHTAGAAFVIQKSGAAAVVSALGTQDTNRHVIALSHDGTLLTVWMDGILIAGPGTQTSSIAFTRHVFGALFRAAIEEGANTRYVNWYLYTRGISYEESEKNRAYIKSKWGGLP